MSKFTKGKWRVKYIPIIQGIFDEDNKPIQLNEANARLIAAAPEMYRMLQLNMNVLETLIQEYDLFEDAGVAWLHKHLDEAEKLLARIDVEDE